MLLPWLRILIGRKPASNKAKGSLTGRSRWRRVRLYAECLGDGTLPAPTVTWIAGSGDWNTASNWQDDVGVNCVPGTADDVVISTSGVAVTHATPDAVHSFTLSNATLQGAGSLTVQGAATLSGATLGGGTLVLDGASSLSGMQNLTLVNGAAINNYGTFDIQVDINVNGDGNAAFNNYGTLLSRSPRITWTDLTRRDIAFTSRLNLEEKAMSVLCHRGR